MTKDTKETRKTAPDGVTDEDVAAFAKEYKAALRSGPSAISGILASIELVKGTVSGDDVSGASDASDASEVDVAGVAELRGAAIVCAHMRALEREIGRLDSHVANLSKEIHDADVELTKAGVATEDTMPVRPTLAERVRLACVRTAELCAIEEQYDVELTKARNVLAAAGVPEVVDKKALAVHERISMLVHENVTLGALDVNGLDPEDIEAARSLKEWRENPSPIMTVPAQGVRVRIMNSSTDEVIAAGRIDMAALPVPSAAVRVGDVNYFVETVHTNYPCTEDDGVRDPDGADVWVTALGEEKFSIREQLSATVDSIEREHGFLARLIEDMLAEADVDRRDLIGIAQEDTGAHELTARVNITKERALELLSQGILGIGDKDESGEVH